MANASNRVISTPPDILEKVKSITQQLKALDGHPIGKFTVAELRRLFMLQRSANGLYAWDPRPFNWEKMADYERRSMVEALDDIAVFLDGLIQKGA